MYRIVGADQKEYGPVTVENIREWVAQGRANGQSLAKFEDGAWKPLATFPEFAPLFATSASIPPGIPPLSTGAPVGGPAITGGIGLGGRPEIKTYLVWSIFATICCCPSPVGIVAIIYSAITSSRLESGDIAGAQRASQAARNWIIASFIVGFLLSILSIPFLIAMLKPLASMPH